MRQGWMIAAALSWANLGHAARNDRIDPLAAVPYVMGQVAEHASSPRLWRITSFPVGARDAACAPFGWSFAFMGSDRGAAPGSAVTRNGRLNLWLAREDGRCAWRQDVSVAPGAVSEVAFLDPYLATKRIVSVAAAEAAAQTITAPTRMVVDEVRLTAPGTIATSRADVPMYLVSGHLPHASVTVEINALTGKVMAAASSTSSDR